MMPWVRLHAVRGYLDMIEAAHSCEAAVTFNFSPSLLEQLRFAAETNPADEFERVSLIPATDLTENDKRFILTHFFSINWDVHIHPHPRFADLLARRGDRLNGESIKQALIEYSAQDYTDLIVLFNLAWIGFTGRKDHHIKALFNKGTDYSFQDIQFVLGYHHEVLKRIIPRYSELYNRDLIGISASPYSHAILPLLCDTRSAAPDIPAQELPHPAYCRAGDADRQLRLAAATHKRTWKREHGGLWPSEGSVSDEALELAALNGFRWAVTDQGILQRSERSRTDNLEHFVSYEWAGGNHLIRIYFRDRALSDAIGFRFYNMPPQDCINEFVGNLVRIEEATRTIPGRCVVIALDGENAWESYPDGGEGFLSGVYNEIQSHAVLELMTFSQHMQTGAKERIHHIHSGSWIESNFRIWIGDPQKNHAWTELGRMRSLLDDIQAGDPARDEFMKWLLRAQGSDWFWWYGEPFSSVYKPHFDELFRAFMKQAYLTAGSKPPPSLDIPIVKPFQPERRLQPMFAITPKLDGRETSFYEWIGSCRIDPRQYGSTMGRSEHSIRAVHYGFNERELFFRFDPVQTVRPRLTAKLVFHALGQKQSTVTIPLDEPQPLRESEGIRIASRDIIEIALDQERLGIAPGMECQFWAEIFDEDILLESLPPSGVYQFMIPTPDMLAAHWIV